MVTAGYEEYNDVKVVKVTIRLDFSTVLPYLIALFWYLQTCIDVYEVTKRNFSLYQRM